eukprot:UN10391
MNNIFRIIYLRLQLQIPKLMIHHKSYHNSKYEEKSRRVLVEKQPQNLISTQTVLHVRSWVP